MSQEIHPIMQKLRINPVAIQKCDYFICNDRKKIFYRHWKPEQKRNKVVIGIHGLAGHSEYYVLVADQLTSIGLDVYAIDLMNHGHSDGQKGDLESVDAIISRINEFVQYLRNQSHEDLKVFMMGISMGGAIAIHYAKKYKPNGLITFAPSVKIKTDISFADLFVFPYYGLMHIFERGKPVVDLSKRQSRDKMSRVELRKQYNDKDNDQGNCFSNLLNPC